VFENESMLKACEQLCNKKPSIECPDWCIIKILDDNFHFHMEMNRFNIAEDYAYMLQDKSTLKRAERRLKCKHEWRELPGGMKCPYCEAVYLIKPQTQKGK